MKFKSLEEQEVQEFERQIGVLVALNVNRTPDNEESWFRLSLALIRRGEAEKRKILALSDGEDYRAKINEIIDTCFSIEEVRRLSYALNNGKPFSNKDCHLHAKAPLQGEYRNKYK